jgi:hypothetical protein
MPTTYKLTPSQRAEIKQRRAAGEPLEKLAEEFGVTQGTISYHAGGVLIGVRQGNALKHEYRDGIAARYLSGESDIALGEECGVSPGAIRVWATRMKQRQATADAPQAARHRRIAHTIQTQYRTTTAAAEYLKISRFTLIEYLHADKFPGAFQIAGPGSDWLIPLTSLEAYKNRRKRLRAGENHA